MKGQTLKELVTVSKPKIETLDKKEGALYKFGIDLLSAVTCEEFLDLPLLPDNRFDTDGLFYTIPYFHDDMLWSNGLSRMVLVVWEVRERSSFCPMQISFEFTDRDNYNLIVHDQTGERTTRKSLFQKDKGQTYTDIPNCRTITLKGLVETLKERA